MKENVEVKVPFENINDPTARIVTWNVASGSEVREGDVIAELENSKATFSIASPAAGFVEYSRTVGEEVPVGERLCCIRCEKSAVGLTPMSVAEFVAESVLPTEASRVPSAAVFSRRAQELIVELGLETAAFSGLVRESDVRQKALKLGKVPSLPASSKSSANSAEVKIDGDKMPLDRAKRLENRELIAADRAALKSTIFHLCTGPVPRLAVILYEAVQLLTKFRHLNACYLDDAAFLYRHVHAGFAVDSGSGLKVPRNPGCGTIEFLRTCREI